MWKQYFSAALRAFRRTPLTTGANVLTLALGLACFVAAYGVAQYWQAGDGHHPGAARLVYVCTYCERGQPGEIQSPERMAAALLQEIPEIEVAGRIGFPQQFAVSSSAGKTFLQGAAADTQVFDLFAFRFVEGRAQDALRRPEDVVLTVEAARRLFGAEAALGRSLRVDGAWDATVAGVVEPMQRPSFLAEDPMRVEFLVNLSAARARDRTRLGVPEGLEEAWTSGAVQTFFRLPATMPLSAFQARLNAFADRVIPRDQRGAPQTTLTAHPISRIHGSIITARFFLGEDLGISAGQLLVALGGLILLVAGANYSNLATAQAVARLKEAGLRKVLGARRGQVLAQHFVEAGLMVLAALLLAVLFVALATPVFRNVLGADPLYFAASIRGVLFLAGVIAASTLAVGLWPALTLAGVRTRDAIGGSPAGVRSTGRLSRTLVGVQFFMASFLLITVVVLEMQQRHLRQAAFQSGGDPVLLLNNLSQTGITPGTLATELDAVAQVRGVAMTQFAPWSGRSHMQRVGRSGNPGASALRTQVKAVSADYFDVFGLELLAGRTFDELRDDPDAAPFAPDAQQPVPVVIDRKLAEALGFAQPQAALGQAIFRSTDPDAAAPGRAVATVAGVVDVEFSTLNANSHGVMFVFDGNYTQATIPVVRIDGSDVAGALSGVRTAWDGIAPHLPLQAQFSDELFEARFRPFSTIAAIFLVLSVMAFVIATAGVLAVAVHVTARRRQEIGVRKTLGASTGCVLRMLMLQLSLPVVIGNVLAWPFAWGLSQIYLRLFVERTSTGPMVFVLTLVATLMMAWLAVGGHAWRAARIRPAQVLQRE